MPNSEDYILDFKAEEKKTQATVFDVEDIESDSNTMSASEADSNESNISTPPLLCKLRKARVMIKKLPRHVLEKHKMINKSKTSNSSSTSSAKPSRVSKRKGNKTVPGLYLSLHVNKPLNEVLNKKKRRQRTCLKTAARPGKIIKPKLVAHNKKSLRLAEKPKEVPIKTEDAGSSSARTTGLRKTNKKHQFPKYLGGSIVNISPIKTTASSSTRPRLSLLEKIAATRRINREEKLKRFVTSARLPNCPDVVITKYDLPTVTTTQFNPENSLLYNPDVVPSLQTYQSYAGAKMLNTPQHNITVQVPASYSTPPTNAFPTRIMSAPRQLPILVNAGSIVPNQPAQMSSSSSLRQNSYRMQKTNDSIRGDSSKALVINQPNSRKEQKKSRKQKERDNYSESDTETCSQAESEYQDIPDTEQRQSSKEPQVIKRIIYHTKAVQTKFTCNGTICGLVDSDEFNLNCFYCYEIFPLHKWREFKEHIKIVHHVEEQSIESEEDEETENLESQSQLTTNSEPQTINLKAKQPLPNKQMFVAKPIEAAAAKEGAYKKLPLEPRLVAQREQEFKKISSQLTPTAVNKSPAKKTSSQQLNLSQQSNTSSRGNVSIDLCDDIVSLDSDDGDDELQLVDDIAENVVKEKDNSKNSNLNKSVSFIDEVAKLIPPHITIKKITNPCSIEKANLNKTTSPQKSISLVKPFINTTTTETIKTPDTSLDEPFIKVPSNSNIQRVIKYIPKPTTEQSTGVETTKPRYFVVKKIVKPATKTPSLNVTKAMLFSKKPKTDDDDDDMPSNDENEDAVPKPTNGCGILFGLTNPMVVIEFLLKLKSFPELWRPQEKKNSVNYDESIKKLCFHLNSRFELNIQDFEMRLSIQRVKDWYCRMLKKIHEHNKNCNNEEPYKHKFPLYFKILNQFLTSDVNFTNNLLLSSRLKSDTNMNKYPKWMVYKTGSPQTPKTTATTINLDEKKEEINNKEVNNSRSLLKTNNNPAVSQETVMAETAAAPPPPTTTPTATVTSPPSAEPPAPPVPYTETNAENNNDDNLIEFDADILYEDESSDEEVLEFFDETKRSNEKLNKNGEPRKKYTKTYSGSHECDVCHKFYKRTCDLRRHRIHHFPPQFECSVCTQKFFFKHWAEKCNHLRKRKYAIMNKTETGGKDGVETVIPRKWPKKIFRFKLICEICGASYRQIGSLNCHKRDKHLNQRLNCVVCNFTALTNYRIVQHQKKRHIVEPGTVEELAKKSRARTDTKTPFSVEARQEFDWRREMRKKLQPGEKFFACCKCRIIFNSRKEKVLHNKLEHPIKETSVVCLLCLPTKFLLSNSNSARRHYTDIHKVPWDEIDALVKRTKPVFNILSKEEIELLNASQNWKELLEELIKDRELEPLEKIKTQIDEEAVQAVQNLPAFNTEPDIEVNKLDVESEETKEEANVYIEGQQQQEEEVEVAKEDENVYVDNIEETKEENVYVDGIIDHDYNNEEMVYYNEHDYSEEQHGETMQHYENYEEGQEGEELQNEQNNDHNNQLYENPQPNVIVEGVNAPIAYNIECTEDVIVDQQSEDNEQQYLQSIMGDLVEGELVDGQLVEECIVVEECIEDVIDEEEEYF